MFIGSDVAWLGLEVDTSLLKSKVNIIWFTKVDAKSESTFQVNHSHIRWSMNLRLVSWLGSWM